MSGLEEIKCILQGNRVDLELLAYSESYEIYEIFKSREILINGLVVFQVTFCITRVPKTNMTRGKYYASINIKLNKTLQSDILTYAIKCSSKELCMNKVTFVTDDTSWRQIYEYSELNKTVVNVPFKLTFELDLHSIPSPMASLHNDTDLTDFELRGEDGSVQVHKAIIAGHSPVLRKLVAGDWREAKEGSVNVQGTTKETLQQFKDYMYDDKLPENGLEQLIVLASYYMMEDLVQKCSFKILNSLSVQNAFELAELAAKYKMRHLFFAILESVEYGNIKVNDIVKQSLVKKSADDTKNDENE